MLTGQMDATAQAPARPSRGALPAQLRGKPELEEAMGRREPGDSGGCGARGTQPLPGRRPVSLTAHEVLGHPSRPWNTQGRGACDSEAQRRPLMAARSPERPERNCRAEPRCAFRVSGGRKAGEDRRAAVPTAAVKAMAVGVRMLRLCRVVPGCGAGWRWIATAAAQLTPPELTEMRNDLFNKEKKRQLSLTPRTEKIEVKHVGKTDPGAVFVMNKNVSTPYSCAMHLSEWYCRKSILALVDGQPWDMYKPLTKSCEIEFLTFKDRDPGEVNKAYWRSCAMMMGCVIERAFKDEYVVSLVGAPEVPVIAGAFCYDVVLDKKLDEWMPTKENLRSFTKDVHALIYKDLPFETLEVEAKVALEIFQHNKYKIDFIEEKASQNPERIVKLHSMKCQRFTTFTPPSQVLCEDSRVSLYLFTYEHILQYGISYWNDLGNWQQAGF
ncbi:large ribosomal subunit protein mL39 isoform X4 [Oryctolagus cuniculus]|uniref:large ribosomal subunit protein mL39 isoform X4 n=3 Tax=Oryctolagus cuniculus TaxID=9986 RepID=UPI003879EFEE